MHFLRLLEVWYIQSAREYRVLSCNCAKYLPIKKFTNRLGNKLFLIWLLLAPPQLTYVATLPCNLSLMSCFANVIFHKVMWQHMQGVVGLFVTSLLQIYRGSFQ